MRLPFSRRRPKYRNLQQEKKTLIDFTFQQMQPPPRSFADLGGVWNVDGAYTFYTLDKFPVDRAVLVDSAVSDAVIKREEGYANLSVVTGNFGEDAVLQQIGSVDAVYLFDVLLHQVSPNWDEILELYAAQTQHMVIFNQQFVGRRTRRLLDLGRDEYFKVVPRGPDDGLYCDLFEKLDEIHPEYGRPWRDLHQIWQWGITDKDLMGKMSRLGFKLQFFANFGRFRKLKHFMNHAFLFRKA